MRVINNTVVYSHDINARNIYSGRFDKPTNMLEMEASGEKKLFKLERTSCRKVSKLMKSDFKCSAMIIEIALGAKLYVLGQSHHCRESPLSVCLRFSG